MDSSASACPCPWLIAIHGGAGYHSTDSASEKTVKHVLRSACAGSVDLLKREEKSIDAVQRAVCDLEDDECLNAGYGSNLTIDGTVECDASIMNGVTHDFGSIGAVQGIKNPISLARAVLENSRKPHPLGRVSPLTLVGSGASAFASSAGAELVNPNNLISGRARSEWQDWKGRLENTTSAIEPTQAAELGSTLASVTIREEHSLLEDTVGAVACDSSGGLSAGVSSGGLLLKYPGRIGEAAVFGAGAWAHSPVGSRIGVACSVSGKGEAIIRTSFARALADALCAAPPEETHSVLQSKLEAFCDEIGERGDEPNVGVLLVTKEPLDDDTNSDSESDEDEETGADLPSTSDGSKNHITPQIDRQVEKPLKVTGQAQAETTQLQETKLRLWCAFTTESMAIAYASSEEDRPRALMMRHRRYRNTDAKRGVHIAALPLSR